ncbi:MAG: hypothetical protein ACW99L_07565 [Promethearchaeota archaeon]|jgi:RecA/RadA recombinase
MSLHETLGLKKHQVLVLNDVYAKTRRQKKQQTRLSVGSRSFDEILEGGFQKSKSYIIFGASKTGKTQLCHQLCVQAYKQVIKKGRVDNYKFIYYFDTENTFRPERINELASLYDFHAEAILKSILVSKVMSNSAFLLALNDFEKMLTEKDGYLLIIDTINNHFRSDLSRENMSYEKAKGTFLNILKKINDLTNSYDITTIITAQVVSNFSKEAIIREIPVGNQFINHFFSEYLYLRNRDENSNCVHLVNSLELTEKKFLYKITSNGIEDYIA